MKAMEKTRWIDRDRLIELLREVPFGARLAINSNGNLTFQTDRATGYVDLEDELVETIPDATADRIDEL